MPDRIWGLLAAALLVVVGVVLGVGGALTYYAATPADVTMISDAQFDIPPKSSRTVVVDATTGEIVSVGEPKPLKEDRVLPPGSASFMPPDPDPRPDPLPASPEPQGAIHQIPHLQDWYPLAPGDAPPPSANAKPMLTEEEAAILMNPPPAEIIKSLRSQAMTMVDARGTSQRWLKAGDAGWICFPQHAPQFVTENFVIAWPFGEDKARQVAEGKLKVLLLPQNPLLAIVGQDGKLVDVAPPALENLPQESPPADKSTSAEPTGWLRQAFEREAAKEEARDAASQ